MHDTFRGDTAHLICCMRALLDLDAKGALAPYCIDGHARQLLESAPVHLEEIGVSA